MLFMACNAPQQTHIETTQQVVEAFYQKDIKDLKENTTPESYNAFIAVHDMMVPEKVTSPSNFKVLEEVVNDDTAWVKFSTSYEEKPETFKLIKVDGTWKVTEKGLREKSPF